MELPAASSAKPLWSPPTIHTSCGSERPRYACSRGNRLPIGRSGQQLVDAKRVLGGLHFSRPVAVGEPDRESINGVCKLLVTAPSQPETIARGLLRTLLDEKRGRRRHAENGRDLDGGREVAITLTVVGAESERVRGARGEAAHRRSAL